MVMIPIVIGNDCTIKGAKLYGPIIIGDNTIIDEEQLCIGIKWGAVILVKMHLIGAIIGYDTKDKDGASVLEKAVGLGVIEDRIIIHPK